MGVTKFLIIPLMVIMIIPSAYAATRADLDNIKNEINNAESDIISLNDKIMQQREKIVQQNIIISEKKEILRDTKEKSSQSWDALKNIESAQKDYDNSVLELASLRAELNNLLNEKNNIAILIKQKQDEIPRIERELNRVPFDSSDITKLVGIQLSKACLTMIINQIPNTCPTYEQLYELDTSKPESGKFVNSNGYFHRAEPDLRNSWRLYDHDPTPRIIVDPPKGMAERIHMIFIQPNQAVYFTPDDMTLSNHTRTWHEHRYIEDCKRAFIDAEQWERILVDTIYTLHNGCTDTTLTELNSETMEYTDLPITDTASWKYKTWMEESKQKCKGLCFEY